MSTTSGESSTRSRAPRSHVSPLELHQPTSPPHNGGAYRVRKPRRSRKLLLFGALGAVLLGGGGVTAVVVLPRILGGAGESALATHVVTRGSFDVIVSASGTLESLNSPTIFCEVEGGATIIEIVDNGYVVTPDDVESGLVLVELDSSALRNQRLQQLIKVQTAENAAEQAELQITIVEDQNNGLLDTAQVALETARANLRQYREGDYHLERETILGQITLAQQELSQATERVRHFERLVRKGYASQSQLEAERLAQETAEINLANAERQLDILDEYTYQTQIVTLEAAVRQAEGEVRRVTNSNAAALAQAQGAYDVALRTLEAERELLADLERQIAACTIRADVPGTVVYVRPRDDDDPPIAEGIAVRERQEIMRVVPSDMQMDLELRVHQTERAKLRRGMDAVLTVDGVPGRQFRGRVRSVGTQPEPISRWRPDVIEYLVLVEVLNATTEIEPGMRAQASIVVQHVDDSLYVPRQAVLRRGNRAYCYVVTPEGPEQRTVTPGPYNNEFVAIEGDQVREGDRVLLDPASVVRAADDEQASEQAPQFGASPGDQPPDAASGDPSAAPDADQPAPAADDPPAPGTGAPGGFRLPSAAEIVSRIDGDRDGRVSREEANQDPRGMMGQFFDQTDSNSDGFLDAGEIDAGIARARQMMQQGGGRGGAAPPGGGRP